ncbi:hypothetical protein [Candidatus Williamhamiltonella defendens]|uniref:hypothetical protein n=1 Tax=Candidatus Williamhamiltonella defendens TaxID=138072 RepID=UPI001F17905C|nr:hypothetical protein [Candidatus Hamiltonella defensa]
MQKLPEFFNTLANETAGYYQFRMGEHILTITKRQSTDQKTIGISMIRILAKSFSLMIMLKT